ncbi:OmpA family protein [Shimia gijangensis]|uniref:OmpA family protein n=1 Tax=Shimia gijangensis TaxID=1470563 RepID=A0A1M6BLZ1_9RHOB|nr:OmpA family protein [Shimia gijangensis]SHI49686.1 OmpA family protein [Shimia gijangensis]
MRKFVTTLFLGGLSTAVQAQSTIEMDEFDLVPNASSTVVATPSVQTGAASEMETCLLDPSKCANSEFKSGTDFTMDDVVNLQLVKHDKTKPEDNISGETVPETMVSSSQPSTQALPTIDIEILFDSGSDRFRADQEAKLRDLALVLSSERFKGYRFLFLGHTDAKGAEDLNWTLSQRRAESVAQVVRLFTGLSTYEVLASGLGETRLKTPSDPHAGVNRRVQLVLLPQ